MVVYLAFKFILLSNFEFHFVNKSAMVVRLVPKPRKCHIRISCLFILELYKTGNFSNSSKKSNINGEVILEH